MLYHFTYKLRDNSITKVKVCHTLREAEVFFDVLISAHSSYICVKTLRIRGGIDDKI